MSERPPTPPAEHDYQPVDGLELQPTSAPSCDPEGVTLEHVPRPETTFAVTARYTIEQKLGEGGMGAVYRASDALLGRTVALKVIRAGSLTADARARFTAEARAVAALDHPHIIKIFDVLDWPSPEGVASALALEYMPGGSLTTALGKRPLPPETAARLVGLLARAVAHAHERGIVHRDLKPDNVLLAPPSGVAALDTPMGCPKVGDFGLARQAAAPHTTQAGAVMGTPAYMAPEQAEGGEVGPPADVWALGVILYRALTGQVPFRSDSVVQLLAQVCTAEPVPPTKVRGEVPAELEAVCLACLRKKPGERPTAAELASRLEARAAEAGNQGTTVTLPRVWRRPRRGVWVTGSLTVALVLVVLVWGIWLRSGTHTGGEPMADPANGVGKPAGLPMSGAEVPREEPLAIRPLAVRLYEREGDTGTDRGVLGRDVFGARFGDGVTITVELSAPAFFYIIGFDFDGKEDLVWPATEKGEGRPNAPPPRLERLRFPDHDEDRVLLEVEGADSGIQAYVVVASRSPLPPYAEWRKRREVMWSRLPTVAGVWHADTKATYPATPAGVNRARVGRMAGDPPLAALCRALARDGEVAEAIAFGVRAKGKGQ